MTTTPPRHDRNTTIGAKPMGGKFRTKDHSDAIVALGLDVDQRVAALTAGGVVAAVPAARASNESAEAWWDRGYAIAEHGTYPKLPDDWTPGHTAGRALSGGRRTHRRTYTGAGVELRMPSASAIRSFAAETGTETFDIPVSASFPGGAVQGWLRVTPQGPGEWSVSALGMDAKAAAYVAEAASAVLEARNPSVALAHVGDLMERRTRRFAMGGVKLSAPNKRSFISGLGYNRDAGTMAIVMSGRTYTYQVPETVFNMVRTAASPGQVYNHLIKGKATPGAEHGAAVIGCEKCGRFSAAAVGHRCPSFHHPAPATLGEHVLAERERALAVFA